MKMTPRDLHILRLVAEHRFVRSTHLQALLGGSRGNLLRRFQKLYITAASNAPAARSIIITKEAPDRPWEEAPPGTEAEWQAHNNKKQYAERDRRSFILRHR
jgi:hypothetical protein